MLFLLFTNFLNLTKKLLLKSSIYFLDPNIGPNLANKVPQVSKTCDKYISPVDTHRNHHDLTLKEFETAHKSLKRNKASGIDDINSNIVLDFYEELKTHYFIFFEPG